MTLSLNAKARTIMGGKVNALRQEGQIPAVIYGHGLKNQNITVSAIEFNKIFKEAGESSLVDLKIDDKKSLQVLIHDLQYDPIKNTIKHIDFYQVNVTEKITAEVKLKFIGESAAVKGQGGVLVTPLTKVKIECLPKDLMHELEVDISVLKTFDDAVRVKDLIIPAGIKILAALDQTVALVEAPRSEEEIKKLEEKPEEKVGEVKTVKEEVAKEVEAKEGTTEAAKAAKSDSAKSVKPAKPTSESK